MAEARLNAKLLAASCVRAASARALPAAVLRRGDPDAGAVFVKCLARDGRAVLYGQTRDLDGALVWRPLTGEAPVDEAAAEDRIAREASIDRDIWVVEVMTDSLDHPLAPAATD